MEMKRDPFEDEWVLTDPRTGESKVDHLWDRVYLLGAGVMRRRAEKHGVDNPIIFRSKKAYNSAVRRLNYDKEAAAGKRQRRIHAKLEEAGQLRLFSGD
jgi:hypothetical protein